MNTLLLQVVTKSVVIGENSEGSGRQQIDSKLFDGKDYGQIFSLACIVLVSGALHSSGGKLQRTNLSTSLLLS